MRRVYARRTDVGDDQWAAPTPCTEWDARALVEHVIGFHEFLLLRPLGVRAHRPRKGPAERWAATSDAMFAALAADGVLDCTCDRAAGGGESTPRTMLGALTTDVLVHTWDLARAVRGADPALDEALCREAYDAARGSRHRSRTGTAGPRSRSPDDAGIVGRRCVGYYGRDPSWTARRPHRRLAR